MGYDVTATFNTGYEATWSMQFLVKSNPLLCPRERTLHSLLSGMHINFFMNCDPHVQDIVIRAISKNVSFGPGLMGFLFITPLPESWTTTQLSCLIQNNVGTQSSTCRLG